jgi:hypothetical protein
LVDSTIGEGGSWSDALYWPATDEQLAASGYYDTLEIDYCVCGEMLFIFADRAGELYTMSVVGEEEPVRYRLHSPAMCRFNVQVKLESKGRRRPGRLF